MINVRKPNPLWVVSTTQRQMGLSKKSSRNSRTRARAILRIRQTDRQTDSIRGCVILSLSVREGERERERGREKREKRREEKRREEKRREEKRREEKRREEKRGKKTKRGKRREK